MVQEYKVWYLLLRVGDEYYPVDWMRGSVFRYAKPTVFTDLEKQKAKQDMIGYRPNDYKWITVKEYEDGSIN